MGLRALALAGLLLLGAPIAAHAARPERIGYFYGYGLGFFAQGGPGIGESNSHLLKGLSISFFDDRLRLRYFKGSLERVDLPIHGDNDADYDGYGVLVTRRWTGLPLDLGVGTAHHRQNFPEGYPDRIGERVELDRWGPVLSAARDHEISRFLVAWAELDAHYVPFPRKETQILFDLGLRVRWKSTQPTDFK